MIRIFSAERNATLRTKPFFLAAAAALVLDGVDINENDLIDQLVGGFIERERREKLLDRHGSPLLSSEQIHRFLQMVSDEMWAGEVRALDRDTVKDLADLAFDAQVVGPDVAQKLQERAGTMAFFTAGSHRDAVEFEHQLFFAYFLGENISVVASTNQDELFRTFVRATLPEGAASFAARRLFSTGKTASDIIRECSNVAGRGSIRPPHLRENAGALIAEFMRENLVEGKVHNYEGHDFKNVVFAGIQFPEVDISKSSFTNVEFRRTDLSKIRLLECVGGYIILQDTVINPEYTKLEIEGISLDESVFGLRIQHSGQIHSVFKLPDVKAALAQSSFPGIQDIDSVGIEEDVLMLVERLFRKFEKSTVFWPTDDVNKIITNDPNWDKLVSILISSGLAVQERVSAQSGAPRPHLRVTAPSEIVTLGQSRTAHVPERVHNFWSDLRITWPSD